MDSLPQTPDAVDPDVKGRHPGPEARSHSIALPLTHAHTRMGLARLAHLHPHGGLCNTSQLNARNRIVRESTLPSRSEYHLIWDSADIKAVTIFDHRINITLILFLIGWLMNGGLFL